MSNTNNEPLLGELTWLQGLPSHAFKVRDVVAEKRGPGDLCVLDAIGHGGFSSVFLARLTGRLAERAHRQISTSMARVSSVVTSASGRGDNIGVALKLLHQDDPLRLDRERTALLDVGAAGTAVLLGHGTVDARQTESDVVGTRPFLLLEYLGRDSLASRMASRSQLARGRDEYLRMCADELIAICEALAPVHLAGWIHRDLKPDNILFRASGRAAIIDLGLALRVHSRTGEVIRDSASLTHRREPSTDAGVQLGTPRYMAPELFVVGEDSNASTMLTTRAGETKAGETWPGETEPVEAGAIDIRADIYALGVIAYELFTGHAPFSGDRARVRHGHLAGRRLPPSVHVPGLPSVIDDLVLRCLAVDPAQRFASALDIAAAMRAALSADEMRMRAPQVSQRERRASTIRTACLAFSSSCALPRIRAFAREREAEIGGVSRDRVVLIFPWAASVATGLRAAQRAARDAVEVMSARGARVLHVAEIRVRRSARTRRFSGDALRHHRRWSSPTLAESERAVSPLVATRVAAAYLDLAEVTALAGTSEYMHVSDGHRDRRRLERSVTDPELCGRDALFAELCEFARQGLRTRIPSLVTLLGTPGLGKSRMLDALAAQLDDSARLLRVSAQTERSSDTEYTLRRLLGHSLEVPETGVTLAELKAAWLRLEIELAEPHLWASAWLLGVADRNAPGVARLFAAPGALRAASTYALVQALRAAAARRPIAVLVDDAHLVDQAALDALERCANGDQAALCIAVAAAPHLRDTFGQSATRGLRRVLEPLPTQSVLALLIELLEPAERPPPGILERMCRATGGIPRFAVELARAVHRRGAIRRRPSGTRYVLDIEDVAQLLDERDVADDYLADESGQAHRQASWHPRVEERIPPDLLGLARLCSVLGADASLRFSQDDVRGVQDAYLQDAHHADVSDLGLDATVAVRRLCTRRLLEPVHTERHGRAYVVRDTSLAQAIRAQMPARALHDMHAACLSYWREVNGSERRTALHASRCGVSDAAAQSYLALGDRACAVHRYLEAREHYNRALAQTRPDAKERAAALAGRGRMRYRQERWTDALTDLRQARALYNQFGDERECVRLMLDEATALDWCQSYREAGELSQRALAAAERIGDEEAILAGTLAQGRTLWRAGQVIEAIGLLQHVVAHARPERDYETLIIAQVLLIPALAIAGRLDESERLSGDVIDTCLRTGDDIHLVAAYTNRQLIWKLREDVERLLADRALCIEAAERLGNPQCTRGVTTNAATMLMWCGRLDEALELAHNARAQQLGLVQSYGHYEEHSVLARVLCARGESGAEPLLDWISTHCQAESIPRTEQWLLRAARLSARALAGHLEVAAWHALIEECGDASGDCAMEISLLAAETMLRAGERANARQCYERALAGAGASRIWTLRLQTLAVALG